MKKYVYQIREKQILVTELGPDPTPFTTEFLNELGQNGEQVITLNESGKPSGIKASDGREIPYYLVTVLTMREADEPSDSEGHETE